MSLLAVADAQSRILALARPTSEEITPLLDAAGRYAARDVMALRTQPAADLSAMDGYAIRFADLPGPWSVVGESAAGRGLDRVLGTGEAARIFTGAPLPAGADTVFLQEEADRDGTRLILTGEGPAVLGAHVRRAGTDFVAGATLIGSGDALTPARIALAAVAGHATLPVRRRVRLALISTGNELVPPGSPTPGTQLPSSNGPMLAAMLAPLPVDITDLGIVRDDLPSLVAAFKQARDADIVVTTGGASVGDHDLVRPALDRIGAEIRFWRIAMKPGKPVMAGTLGDTVVLGLPGNPVSAFVTATIFLKPLIRAFLSAAEPLPRLQTATLADRVPAAGRRAEYLRGRWLGDRVVQLSSQDSAGLSALANAELLIARPAYAGPAHAGEAVQILPL